MTEQKRRGRPPKTEQPSRLDETVAAFTEVVGIVSPAITPLAESLIRANVIGEGGFGGKRTEVADEPMHPYLTAEVVTVANDAAQAYALRVWAGQTETIPRNERIRRVTLALEGQGMTMEGVVLP